MINEIGHFTLLLAFCVALLQATVPLFGAHKGRIDLMAISESAANLQFALLFAFIGFYRPRARPNARCPLQVRVAAHTYHH